MSTPLNPTDPKARITTPAADPDVPTQPPAQRDPPTARPASPSVTRPGGDHFTTAPLGPGLPPVPQHAFELVPPGGQDGRPALQLVRAVEGPWNVFDPVHEGLTLTSLREAVSTLPPNARGPLLQSLTGAERRLPAPDSTTAHNLAPERIDARFQQFVRGAVWPDDPEGNLFDDPIGTTDYGSGAAFYHAMDVRSPDDPRNLTARSHNGDLAFFHCMATREGEPPQQTVANVLNWSHLLARIATGELGSNVRVRDDPALAAYFSAPQHQNLTVRELLSQPGVRAGRRNSSRPPTLTDAAVRQRAAGALMHLVHDAYTTSHVQRNIVGEITQFQFYGAQNAGRHRQDDQWSGGNTFADHINNTYGARTSVEHATHILLMLDQGRSPNDVAGYLYDNVLRLAPDVQSGGSARTYRA
jgi:hypothetical protein